MEIEMNYIMKVSYKDQNILIVEAKEFLLNRFKLTNEIILSKELDTRIMICIGKLEESIRNDLNEVFDYIIYIYDKEDFIENNDIIRAIIKHEIGHIEYPSNGIEEEIACDLYAMKEVNAQAVYDALNLCINELKKIGQCVNDLEFRKKIIKPLL